MLPKRYSVLIALLFVFFSNVNFSKAQCSVTSSNGWTVNINITPTAVIPEFATNCPWYYHYELRYNYTITFSGSTTGRSFSCNAYFTCSGGTGGNPYYPMGTFTGNSSGTLTTNNNSRQYSATSPAYNYGSNPACTAVTLADVNCTSVRLDYWGNGISNGSIVCALSTAPLPIELLSFNAVADGNKVNLKWTTATEVNNDYFTVEKSRDGISFEQSGRVRGAGNSTSAIEYTNTDNHPFSGLSYYRLKQTDFNGDFTYSKIVPVETGEGNSVIITNVYPNPSNGPNVNIYVSSASLSPVDVDVFNPLGQRVSHLQLQPNDNGIIDMQIPLPEEGNLFFVSFSQDNKITGHHKLCVTRNK